MKTRIKAALLGVLVSASLFSHQALADGLFSGLFDTQSDVRERIEKQRVEQEARDHERRDAEAAQRKHDQEAQVESDRRARAEFERQIEAAKGSKLTVTYRRAPARAQALACADPEQKADCRSYLSGFVDTVAMTFKLGGGIAEICDDTALISEELLATVQQRPDAGENEVHEEVFNLLKTKHRCPVTDRKFVRRVTAESLLDTCKTSDIGFSLCSQYQAGFVDALLFMSEKTGEPVLCGDSRLLSPSTLSSLLNVRLHEDADLQTQPAVQVMFNELSQRMPCH